MENQPAVPLASRSAPRRPPPLLLRHRTWKSRRSRSTAPLAGDLLPAMASRGHLPWPPARKEGGGRAKSGRHGAREGRCRRRSRTSRPPDPAAAATGRARGRRIWPAPPWKGTRGGSRRGRSVGRRNSAATLELERARAAVPLPFPKSTATRQRMRGRRGRDCGLIFH